MADAAVADLVRSVRFTARTTSDGVLGRDFTLGDIPGVLWSPAVRRRRRRTPTLGRHKELPRFESDGAARFLARQLGTTALQEA
ncbi:hypothetical protein [Streptomyces sp. HF10]|uniref:hypothetical protein n=1 Tax=Streptomyces sp. HF10 TaxID=2692233 RepID=UPI0019168695|nr:hypothetical protein [Streptomyces sp. HF10]